MNVDGLLEGAGLGLRRGLMNDVEQHCADSDAAETIDFYEIAPENWISMGGRFKRRLKALTEKYKFVCHGLSLSLGSPAPLDEEFVLEVKEFLDEHNILCYSEHLSYCSDEGHLYDLMPIPFTSEAVKYVARRIQRVQELLERRVAIENVSYYAAPGKEMDEVEFVNAVVKEADCDLLLDINNIYVNSVNHGYNAEEFLAQMPFDRVAYMHVAGHYNEAEDLIVDTHGANVIDPVWCLLEKAYTYLGPVPTLLERDFNFPPFAELLAEVSEIRHRQSFARENHSKIVAAQVELEKARG